MLVIGNEEHFKKVKKWAEENGHKEKFDKWMKWAREYGCRKSDDSIDESLCRVTLYYDFAPNSFGFNIEFLKDGGYRFFMNGGLIWHKGSQDWSAHT